LLLLDRCLHLLGENFLALRPFLLLDFHFFLLFLEQLRVLFLGLQLPLLGLLLLFFPLLFGHLDVQHDRVHDFLFLLLGLLLFGFLNFDIPGYPFKHQQILLFVALLFFLYTFLHQHHLFVPLFLFPLGKDLLPI